MKKRVLKKVALWSGVVVLALALTLLVTVGILTGTDFGRQTIVDIGTGVANDALSGRVTIGELTGSLFSDFTITDIAVADDRGHEMARIDRLRVAYELSELVDGRVHVTAVEVDGPSARLETMPDGRTNFEHLVPPSEEPPPPEEPSGPPPELEIVLDRLAIDGITFRMGPVDTATTMVERGVVRLSARAPLPNASIDLRRLSAHATQQNLDVWISAKAAFEDEVATLQRLIVRADDHPVVGADATFAVATTEADATVRIDVPPDLVRKLSAVPELDVALTATVTAGHAGPTEPWLVKTVGRLGDDADLDADVAMTADFARMTADLEVLNLNPMPIHPAAPSAKIDLRAGVRGPLDDLAATATVTAARVNSHGSKIERAEITADVAGIPAAIRGRATLRAKGLVLGRQRFGNAAFDVTIGDNAQRIELDGSLTEGWPFAIPQLRAAVRMSQGAVALSVRELALATREVVWRGEDIRIDVTPSGMIALDGLTLTSPAGRLTAGGRLSPDAPLRKSKNLRLRIDDVRLGAFSELVPGVPKLAGRLEVNARLDSTTSSVAVTGRDISVDDLAPVDLDVLVRYAQRKLDAKVDLDGHRLGVAHIRAEATTPADPLNVAAWQIRPLDRVRDVRVRLVDLDLAEVAAIAKVKDLEGGRVNAKIALAGRRLDLDVDAQDVLLQALSLPLDAELRVTSTSTRTDGALDARLGERRVAEIVLDFDTGLEDLERRKIAALRDASGTVDLRLDELSLGRLAGAVNATTTPPLAGVVTGSALIEKRGVDLEAHIDMFANDARAVANAPLADGRVHVDLVKRRLDARVWVEGEGDLEIDAHAVVQTPADPLDAEGWKSIHFDQIRSVTASVSHAKLGVLAAMGDLDLPSAEVEAAVRIGPGLSKPRVYATVHGVNVAPLLTEVGAVVTVDERGGGTHVQLGAFANERPLLDATVDVPRTVRQLAETDPKKVGGLPLNGRVRSVPFDIRNFFSTRAIAERFGGTLDLAVDVAGRVDHPKVDAKIAVNRAKIGGSDFERFRIDAVVDGKDVTAKVDASQKSGGKLAVDASIGEELDVAVAAERFTIDFVADLLRAASGSALGLAGAKLDATIDVTGKPDAPKPSGTLTLNANRIVAAAGAPPLEQAKIDVTIDGGDIDAKVRGEIGDGPVRVDTKATVLPPEALAFSTTIETDKIRVAAGPTAAIVSMSIQVDGERKDDRLEIDVVSDGGTVLLPGDPGGGDLHPIGGMDDVVFVDPAGRAAARAKKKVAPSEDALQTIVRIRTKGALKVEGDQVRTAVEVALEGRTTPDGFALNGNVQLPRGRLKLIAHEYEIERAKVLFDGQLPIVPRLDVALTKDFGDTTFSVLVSGTANKPDLRFTASPNIYSQGELMQIFLGGEPGASGGGEPTNTQALTAAAGFLLGPVTQALRQSLPIDTIDFETGTSEDGDDVNAALTLGKWLTDDLFIAYKYTFQSSAEADSTVGEGLLRYRFSGTWVAELKYLVNYGGSAEVLWVKRF